LSLTYAGSLLHVGRDGPVQENALRLYMPTRNVYCIQFVCFEWNATSRHITIRKI